MAIAQVISGAPFPGLIPFTSGGIGTTAMTIDASAEKVAFRLFAPRSGILDAFEFRISSFTNAAGGVKVSFQGLDANADPDGVISAYRVVTTATGWIAPAIMTDDGTDTGVPLTVARGQSLYCVMEIESFTAGDIVNIATMSGLTNMANIYVNQYTAAWAKFNTRGMYMAFRYSDGTYPVPFGYNIPFSGSSIGSGVSVNNSPDEAGLAFSYPAPVMIGGALIFADVEGDAEFRFYRPSVQDAAVQTYVQDKDDRSTSVYGYFYFPFTEDIRIEANEECIISMAGTTTTSPSLAHYTVPSSTYLELMEMGSIWRWVSRTDLGTWDENTVRRPYISPVVTGLDHEIGGQPSMGFSGTP